MDEQPIQLPPPSTELQKRKPKFKGFPRVGANGSSYDMARIKREYLDHAAVEWTDYCRARGYNPDALIPWRPWIREKKYRASCQLMAVELEKHSASLGPNLLLQKIKAVKYVPEAAAVMFQLVQHALRIHQAEAKQDEKILKQVATDGRQLVARDLHFSLDPGGILALSAALKQTSELLYKSLGIDPSSEMTPDRWQSLAETELAQIEGSTELLSEAEKSPVTIEVIGAPSVKDAMSQAFDKWMDKPGSAEPLIAGLPPPPDGAEEADA